MARPLIRVVAPLIVVDAATGDLLTVLDERRRTGMPAT